MDNFTELLERKPPHAVLAASAFGDAVDSAWQSFKYSLVQAPITGVAQLVDGVAGTNLLSRVHLVDEPKQAQFGSLAWHAQALGGALGSAIPFMLVYKAIRGCASLATQSKTIEKGVTEFLKQPSAKFKIAIAESAANGFVFDSVFRQSDSHDGSLSGSRLRNGMAGALSFGVLTASSMALRGHAMVKHAERPRLIDTFKEDVKRHALGGAFAGVIDANIKSALNGKGIAGAEESIKSAYSFAMLGSAIRAEHELLGRFGGTRTLADIVSSRPDIHKRVLESTEARDHLSNHGARRITNLLDEPLLPNLFWTGTVHCTQKKLSPSDFQVVETSHEKSEVKLSHDPVANAAQLLNETVEAIVTQFSKNTTVVILGRDAWPLVPALRYRGMDARYFLWSRLQTSGYDSARQQAYNETAAQWRKEMPKGCTVIDTGYHGTILDSIRTVDPEIQGYLLSSSGKYPTVRGLTVDRDLLVRTVERFPKAIGRCVGYKRNVATLPENTRDIDEARLETEMTLSQTAQLLRHMNLPEDWVSRYTTFTGITPRQRLGLEEFSHCSQARPRSNDMLPFLTDSSLLTRSFYRFDGRDPRAFAPVHGGVEL